MSLFTARGAAVPPMAARRTPTRLLRALAPRSPSSDARGRGGGVEGWAEVAGRAGGQRGGRSCPWAVLPLTARPRQVHRRRPPERDA